MSVDIAWLLLQIYALYLKMKFQDQFWKSLNLHYMPLFYNIYYFYKWPLFLV